MNVLFKILLLSPLPKLSYGNFRPKASPTNALETCVTPRGFPPCSQSEDKISVSCSDRLRVSQHVFAILDFTDATLNQQIIWTIRPLNEKTLNEYGVKCVSKCFYLFDLWSCTVFLRWKSSKDWKQQRVSLSFTGHEMTAAKLSVSHETHKRCVMFFYLVV